MRIGISVFGMLVEVALELFNILKLYLMKTSQDRKSVRQNGDYTATRKHEVNLRRNPTLHFQIGLILSLLAAIFFIEMRTPVQHLAEKAIEVDESVDWAGTFIVEKQKVVQQKTEVKTVTPTPVQPTDFKVVEEISALEETLFTLTEPDPDSRIIPASEVTVIETPVEIETKSFDLVEEVPLFPGCEKEKSNAAKRDCMNSKINKFVRRKFNTDRAEGLGLDGVNRIRTLFTIDQNGEIVDVQVRAPHPKLEAEAKRVINLLPEMTPGKQQDKAVKVKFALPIVFQVRD